MMTGKKKELKTCDERQNTEVKLVTKSKNAEMKISLHVERVRIEHGTLTGNWIF